MVVGRFAMAFKPHLISWLKSLNLVAANNAFERFGPESVLLGFVLLRPRERLQGRVSAGQRIPHPLVTQPDLARGRPDGRLLS